MFRPLSILQLQQPGEMNLDFAWWARTEQNKTEINKFILIVSSPPLLIMVQLPRHQGALHPCFVLSGPLWHRHSQRLSVFFSSALWMCSPTTSGQGWGAPTPLAASWAQTYSVTDGPSQASPLSAISRFPFRTTSNLPASLQFSGVEIHFHGVAAPNLRSRSWVFTPLGQNNMTLIPSTLTRQVSGCESPWLLALPHLQTGPPSHQAQPPSRIRSWDLPCPVQGHGIPASRTQASCWAFPTLL